MHGVAFPSSQLLEEICTESKTAGDTSSENIGRGVDNAVELAAAVGRNKSALVGVSGELTGRMPETVVARPYSGQHPTLNSTALRGGDNSLIVTIPLQSAREKYGKLILCLYDIERKDFACTYPAWQTLVHPEDRSRGSQEVQYALLKIRPFDTEFRVSLPNGDIRHIKAKRASLS